MTETTAVARTQYLDAQTGVIGALLIDANRTAGEIFARTKAEHYSDAYRTIWSAAKSLYDKSKPIDPVTIKAIVGNEYTEMMLQLMDATPTVANYTAYLDLLLEQYKLTQLQSLGMQLAGCRSEGEIDSIIAAINDAVVQRQSVQIVNTMEGHVDFLCRMDEKPTHLSWFFPSLTDAVTSSPGDFVVLGGRPSSGKTALALQMAWEQAKTKRVGFFSLETRPAEIYDRLHAMVAHVDSKRIRMHEMTSDDFGHITDHNAAFESNNLDVINASEMTVSEIRHITMARRYEIIYIDYLQIVNPGERRRKFDRFGDVSQISIDLHALAVSLGVLVVALSQLSRPDPGAKAKAPTLASLRESGQIEQDADAVFLLWKNAEDKKENSRILQVAKNKKGSADGMIILGFDGSTQTFRDLPKTSDTVQKLVAAGQEAQRKNKQQGQVSMTGFEDFTGPDPDFPF